MSVTARHQREKNIYHPKDLSYAIIQEKRYVELVTNINKNCDIGHANPYFGQRDGGTWKLLKLDQDY